MPPDTLRQGSEPAVRRLYPYTATSDERQVAAPEKGATDRLFSWGFVTDHALRTRSHIPTSTLIGDHRKQILDPAGADDIDRAL